MKVSIIVNVFKGTEKYLPECLESIASQTVDPHEVVVVVDGFTKPMIYPNTITVIRDKNIGIAKSRDQGVKIATGNYFLFVDADDCLSESFLQEMMSQVRWQKADVVYPNCILWSRWGGSKLKNGSFVPPYKLELKDMMKQNYIVVTSLMKREVYEKIGGFNPDLILFEDYEFFFKAFLMGYKFVRAGCFLKYRQRTESRNRANGEHKERIYKQIRDSVTTQYNTRRFSKRKKH